MKVLLVESHKAPVISIQVWVKTGSADEKKKEEGLSHFIEHLVFKGTEKFGVGQIAKLVEGNGGELNAYTTFDHTVFYVTMSSTELETGLDVLSQMMGKPRFDAEEINKEREVVIEEIKRSFDNPNQVASQQLFSTVFKKHPYGIPVIGFDKNIKSVSVKKIIDYYQSRYVPANMCLVVSGDIEKLNTKKLVEKYFGEFKKLKLKKIKRAKEPKQKNIAYSYRAAPFKEAVVNIAFKIPGVKSKDIPALDVLGIILGYGDSSRLVKKLRLEKPLVTYIGAGSYSPLDQGVFVVTAHLRLQNIQEVLAVIGEEISKILSVPVEMSEIEAAKLNLESDEIYGLETVDGLARKVGYYQTLVGTPQYVQKYISLLQKVGPKEILAVARKYFSAEKINATILLNNDESKKFGQKHFFDEILKLKATLKVKAKPAKAKPVKNKKNLIKIPLSLGKATHKIEKLVLPNGSKLILKHNPEIPTMSLKMGMLGGLRLEQKKTNGITTLLSNTWAAGTEKLSEEEIAKIVESAAGSYSCFGGRNSIGVSLETLTMNFDKLRDVFKELLLKPQFHQDKIDREAKIQIENIKSKEDNPSSIAIQNFMAAIFDGHPYALDILGEEAYLKSAQQKDILNIFEKTSSAKNSTFVAVGDFDKDKIFSFFDEIDKQKNKGEKQNPSFNLENLNQSKNLFIPLKKEQAHIVYGFRGLTLSDERRYVLQIIQAMLAGQGGRLFIELRDKASLAYTVAPVQLLGIDAGYFGAYIGCSPEKTETAIEMLKIEFQKMAEKISSEEEIERAKKYLIGQNHIGLQRNSSQANSILFDEIYGLNCEEAFEFYKKVKDIHAADIEKLAKDLFSKPAVTVVVGPNQPKVGF